MFSGQIPSNLERSRFKQDPLDLFLLRCSSWAEGAWNPGLKVNGWMKKNSHIGKNTIYIAE